MASILFKWLLFSVFLPLSATEKESLSDGYHPYYVSVTEINHNAPEKTLEITCKIFTDDFEKILGETYKTKVDLMNPPDRPAMDKLINDYIKKRLSIKVDGKAANYTFLGFEREEEAVYSYFQVENLGSVKKIDVVNSILHDLTENQINIMHVTVGGNRKSTKLDFPKKEAAFSF